MGCNFEQCYLCNQFNTDMYVYSMFGNGYVHKICLSQKERELKICLTDLTIPDLQMRFSLLDPMLSVYNKLMSMEIELELNFRAHGTRILNPGIHYGI